MTYLGVKNRMILYRGPQSLTPRLRPSDRGQPLDLGTWEEEGQAQEDLGYQSYSAFFSHLQTEAGRSSLGLHGSERASQMPQVPGDWLPAQLLTVPLLADQPEHGGPVSGHRWHSGLLG